MAIPPFRESCVLPSLPIMNNVNSFVPFHNGSLLCLSLCLCLYQGAAVTTRPAGDQGTETEEPGHRLSGYEPADGVLLAPIQIWTSNYTLNARYTESSL